MPSALGEKGGVDWGHCDWVSIGYTPTLRNTSVAQWREELGIVLVSHCERLYLRAWDSMEWVNME